YAQAASGRLPVPDVGCRNCKEPPVPVASRGAFDPGGYQTQGDRAKMITRKSLDRRTFLRGAGTAVSLPFLDAMVPAFAAPRAAKTPTRMCFVYVPNGIDMKNWNPAYEGPLGELPRILKPLEPFKEDILLMGNLTHNTGRALLDGAGDHGRCCGSYMTGIQVKKSTTDIKAGVSMDQIVAKEIGSQTRFPSLELGLEDSRQSGDCDSGYSC